MNQKPEAKPGEVHAATFSDSKHPVDVVFVAGLAKSGSTILDRLLSTQPRFLGLGEIDHMLVDEKLFHERAKTYGDVENLPCSCGAPLRTCEFWAPVMVGVLNRSMPSHADRYEVLIRRAVELLSKNKTADGVESQYSPAIVDSSKEVGALQRVLACVKESDNWDVTVSVLISYRDPRDWLVSDDLKETRRGRKRNFTVRRRRLQKWRLRHEEILEEIDRHGLPSLVIDLAHLQVHPHTVLNRVLHFLERPGTPDIDIDLSRATSHVVWGSHHRLDPSRAHSVWKSTHLRRVDIWLLPWLLSPGVWPFAATVRKLRKLSRSRPPGKDI